MPTYNRRAFLPRALECYLRQDWPDKELIVVDDGDDCIADLLPGDRNDIRYIRLDKRTSIGEKRNVACRYARGDVILHWDDDDWSASRRIRYQVEALLASDADLCGCDQLLYLHRSKNEAWRYAYPPHGRTWVGGNTFCYRKSFWAAHPFPDVMVGEDSQFVWSASGGKVLRLDDPTFIVGSIHEHNVSPKRVGDAWWIRQPFAEIQALLAESGGERSALVAASRGIGDILRVTPLIRVLYKLGYTVDVLVEPDYPETATLLQGAPEIRRVFTSRQQTAAHQYDAAAFTYWSARCRDLVKSKRAWTFAQNEWLAEGDSRSIEKIARAIGWTEVMPEPFACPSSRRFDLPPGTVAIHPGCKPDWPWKKWHGFDELAALLPEVAVIGSASDLENSRTYFQREFRWPAHARNFIGKLDLRDTAALISQCRALISNDSGMMHLGAALGVPTLGIFGITSPDRECMPSRNMFPITKELPCEPDCRKGPWGRRDCEHHLACLKTLSAEEVLQKLERIVPAVSPKGGDMERLSLAYYANVFDASGYGNAARGYIRALLSAGIDVSVVDTGAQPRQVRDELMESLLGRRSDADFHLFHGIPTYWAREAFRLPNAIGMTVWETDTMPTQWRNALNHVIDLWLPCEFNVDTFRRDLRTPIFKLPHVLPERPALSGAALPVQGIAESDVVFYSIFEWQDRKCPAETMLAFLRAFPGERDAVLVMKVNPGAATAAAQAVQQARAQTESAARIETRAEAWDEADIEALHRRGDCYLSLHRGEGWSYPLFEAASRGTPVIATGYSGPLDYLDGAAHHLVSYELTPVRQQYAYYHSRMRWADPNLTDAARAMRCVYENIGHAREKARAGASQLRVRYSKEAVGQLAGERLFDLLRRTQPQKWERLKRARTAGVSRPPVPVPAEWYDADYFEHGVKSNWDQGYHWHHFSGLFQETAAFLAECFPEAQSILDVGCAKGFLVRALREAGRECWGFDTSRWAVEHAEEAARPFIECAGIDDVRLERKFDLLVAFEVFEHLTEAQAAGFLKRARAAVNIGILATIPSYEGDTPPPPDADDRDLAHVTIESRAWWHDLFLRCNWKQDPLHRVAERACQRHPLPSKMNWKVYLYAPAS